MPGGVEERKEGRNKETNEQTAQLLGLFGACKDLDHLCDLEIWRQGQATATATLHVGCVGGGRMTICLLYQGPVPFLEMAWEKSSISPITPTKNIRMLQIIYE